MASRTVAGAEYHPRTVQACGHLGLQVGHQVVELLDPVLQRRAGQEHRPVAVVDVLPHRPGPHRVGVLEEVRLVHDRQRDVPVHRVELAQGVEGSDRHSPGAPASDATTGRGTARARGRARGGCACAPPSTSSRSPRSGRPPGSAPRRSQPGVPSRRAPGRSCPAPSRHRRPPVAGPGRSGRRTPGSRAARPSASRCPAPAGGRLPRPRSAGAPGPASTSTVMPTISPSRP